MESFLKVVTVITSDFLKVSVVNLLSFGSADQVRQRAFLLENFFIDLVTTEDYSNAVRQLGVDYRG